MENFKCKHCNTDNIYFPPFVNELKYKRKKYNYSFIYDVTNLTTGNQRTIAFDSQTEKEMYLKSNDLVFIEKGYEWKRIFKSNKKNTYYYFNVKVCKNCRQELE